jgi:CheY-like chemotaxis protein
VLIVDDDPGVRRHVRVSLEAEGYSVREAANADEGMQTLENETPDLILLDVMMPQVDGWEMLRRVQERHGVGVIPVVMFSGRADELEEEAAARGAQGAVGKPFDAEQLVEQTKQLLPV